MKKNIFIIVLLAISIKVIWAIKPLVQDSLYKYKESHFDCYGCDWKDKEFIKKRYQFCDSLLRHLVKENLKDIHNIKDTVLVNFIVNKKGLVDSVWLVKNDNSSLFVNTCKFIKNYDFQGPLIEYYGYRYSISYLVMLCLVVEINENESRLSVRKFDVKNLIKE